MIRVDVAAQVRNSEESKGAKVKNGQSGYLLFILHALYRSYLSLRRKANQSRFNDPEKIIILRRVLLVGQHLVHLPLAP